MGSGERICRIPRKELTKTILCIVESRAEAARIEREFLGDRWDTDDLCLNLCVGGGNFVGGHAMSEETKAKISTAHKGVRNSAEHNEAIRRARLGTTRSLETCRRISEGRIGIKVSPEGRRNMSQAKMGNQNALGFHHMEETKRYFSSLQRGIPKGPPTEEARRNMSRGQTGRKHSAETRAKMSASQKRRFSS